MGETGRYLNMKVHWNLVLMLADLIGLSCQLDYYYNHLKGIEPTFIRAFQMMSGSVTPLSVGIEDKRDVKRLLKYEFRVAFKLLELHVYIGYVLMAVIIFTFYALNEDLATVIIYGVPNSLWSAIWLNAPLRFVLTQFLYYYIVCKYLIIKINRQNERAVESEKTRNGSGISGILIKLDSIYREIDEYNDTFLSKFVFIIWLYLGAAIMLLIFVIIFRDIIVFMRVILIYGIIVIYGSLHFVFITGASLNNKAFRTYKLFNAIMAKRAKDGRIVRAAKLNQTQKVFQ